MTTLLHTTGPFLAASDEELREGAELEHWDFGNPGAKPGFTFLDKLMERTGWERDYAVRCVDEFRRFVFMRARYLSGHILPSRNIDEVWHCALLYTKRYRQMCRQFLSGRFMDHQPSSSQEERERLRQLYAETLELYRITFGTEAPIDIWQSHCADGSSACGDCCA